MSDSSTEDRGSCGLIVKVNRVRVARHAHGSGAADPTVSTEEAERLRAKVAETQQVRARRKSSASYVPPPTELTGNATPITIRAIVEGRTAAKKLTLPASAGFDVFMQRLAEKCKCGVDVVSYKDEDGYDVEMDDEETWREAAQGALGAGGALMVQVTLEA